MTFRWLYLGFFCLEACSGSYGPVGKSGGGGDKNSVLQNSAFAAPGQTSTGIATDAGTFTDAGNATGLSTGTGTGGTDAAASTATSTDTSATPTSITAATPAATSMDPGDAALTNASQAEQDAQTVITALASIKQDLAGLQSLEKQAASATARAQAQKLADDATKQAQAADTALQSAETHLAMAEADPTAKADHQALVAASAAVQQAKIADQTARTVSAQVLALNNTLQKSNLVSPLIIDLSGTGLALSSPADGVDFDIAADGRKDRISWPIGTGAAFLALDANGDGVIDDGSELFGDHMDGPDGKAAANGFLALAKYDANHDGSIDRNDPIYDKLLLWIDENHDGISQPWELHSLAELGIDAIDLSYIPMMEVDTYGNATEERSVVNLANGQRRLIVDLWFMTRD